MRKNETTLLLKECIEQSLLKLLWDRHIDDISVKEIVEKAGVNRSTYYRHFATKQDVVRYFYAHRLDDYLMTVSDDVLPLQYFTGMFESFLRYKKELILLDSFGLSYLLLEELNSRIPQIHSESDEGLLSLYCNYHIGGVFNSFRYWLREEMQTPPEILAQKCLTILPAEFSPQLLKRQSCTSVQRL